MLRKLLWAIAGCIAITASVIWFARPCLIHSTFQWLLEHPFAPISAALALWAILALLGEKNLQKAIRIELVALIVLFHQDFGGLALSVFNSIAAFWRGL